MKGIAGSPGQRRRIVLVANTDWYLYNFRLSLARKLRDRGWDVHLVSPEGPYVERLRAEGFPWVGLALSRRGVFLPAEALTVLQMTSLYRKLRPEVVHHHTLKAVLYGSLAARWAGVPHIVDSVTGLGYVFLSHQAAARLLRGLVLLGLRQALASPRVHVVFENSGDRDFFAARGLVRPLQHSLIEGVGVDLNLYRFSPEPEGPPVVVLASRMLWDKGVGDFVEAVRRLRVRLPTARFALVGAPDVGNPSSIPIEQIQSWVDEGIVEWWGHRHDMPNVFAQSHIVVLPSRGEGVPSVLLEAAASGRPVVATDIPGCRDVVVEGETGSLVPPGEVKALTEALATLMGDPDLRKKMGSRARARAQERFDQEEVNVKTIAIYERLLAAGR